jgi:hypothetical protein
MRCTKLGCVLPYDRKLELFQQFWDTGNFDQQSYALAMHMDIMDVKERTTDNGESRRGKTIKYYIRDRNGVKFECCLSTFQDVFSVSPGRIKTISGKLSMGKIDLRDQRGKNSFNPYEIGPELKAVMLDHIRSLPRTLSHYSRQVT